MYVGEMEVKVDRQRPEEARASGGPPRVTPSMLVTEPAN